MLLSNVGYQQGLWDTGCMIEREPIERAVVVGAGMAGLAAAAALRETCDEVIVLERDPLPNATAPRRGVPQGRQLHNLLGAAQVQFESLMPGYLNGLREHGVGEAAVAEQTHVSVYGVDMPEENLGFNVMTAKRPILEGLARARIADAGNISIVGFAKVMGLQLDAEGRLAGMRARIGETEQIIEAPLVVDATGTGSLTPRWLDVLGIEPPVVEEEIIHQWFVSAILQRPQGHRETDNWWLTLPSFPATTGGVVAAVNRDEWYFSVSGRAQDRMPETVSDMHEHATNLQDNGNIASLVQDATVLEGLGQFKKRSTTVRRYDKLDAPLPGLIPIGDSVGTLNPLFGQGMTVASRQALILRELLAQGGSLEAVTKDYLGQAVSVVREANEITKLMGSGMSPELAQAVHDDPSIYEWNVRALHGFERVEVA